MLRLRSGELDAVNRFPGSALRSLGDAVVVVTSELRVREWSPGAEDTWGVRTDEAESMFLTDLGIGLLVSQLTPLVRQTLAGKPGRATVDGTNRRGRPVRMDVRARLLTDTEGRRRA